jgi:hypothetical protein
MPLEEALAQHKIWDYQQHASSNNNNNNPLELSLQYKLWLFLVFVLVSFLCLGYVFWIVMEKEKKEQKNK